ncbi:MAG: hypothetical protein IJN50_01360 [Clostridia bacterium]|nr:hypothetical protein [Clostridia bacterium]
MKIARYIFNVLTVISVIATIVVVIIGKSALMMIFLMAAIIFFSVSDKFKQKETASEIRELASKEYVEIQLKESTNPIWDEVRKHGNCYMKIQGDIATIKVVIGEKEIEIPPIKLTDIEKYINTD